MHTEPFDKDLHGRSSQQQQLMELSKKLTNISVGRDAPEKRPLNPESLYTMEEVIGKGTFGTVYRASHRQTGESVAIKKVLQDKRYKNRELQILKMLHHPNVLEIISHYYTVDEVTVGRRRAWSTSTW